MSPRVLLLVGTRRGAFMLESDADRSSWQLRGPLGNAGWSYHHLAYDHSTGALYAAGHNNWYGTAVWRSPDLGATWDLSSEGMRYGDDGPGMRQIWHLAPLGGRLLAGVDPAGLFRSDDGGANWVEHGAPLRSHPSFPEWRPGKGGLAVHSILPHPADPRQLWVAVSGGGVLHTADGGASWTPRNPTPAGGHSPLRAQKLAMAPGGPDRLYLQHHSGVFRSEDGGLAWADVSAGLPTPFGFTVAAHPHDPDTVYVIPIDNERGTRFMPGGQAAVWRSRSGGVRWERLSAGLPEQAIYVSVLRAGLAADCLSPAGIYFGTTGGQLYGSRDEGESWTTLAAHLPEIYSVTAVVITE